MGIDSSRGGGKEMSLSWEELVMPSKAGRRSQGLRGRREEPGSILSPGSGPL